MSLKVLPSNKLLERFTRLNVALSRTLDRVLPAAFQRDGNASFRDDILPGRIRKGDTVYDVGGGSQPYVSRRMKHELDLHVVGLDIDADELAAAPTGVYDRLIVADLCNYRGQGDADVVICRATLEHVPDTSGAIRGIASTLKPGGRAFIFASSRNAVFARLNRVLPQRLKQILLFTLFPRKAEGHAGFKAYYDRCIPSQIEAFARDNDLDVEERHLFWISSYFMIFTPVFIIWRIVQGFAYLVLQNDAAETFAYVLRRPVESQH